MSKLNLVRQALTTNPDIVIIHTEELNDLETGGRYPKTDERWPHITYSQSLPDRLGAQLVSFYVAPKKPLYSIKELQAFMLSLTPNLAYDAKEDFFERENYMNFGWLGYDDKIGEYTETRERVLKLIEEDMFDKPGFIHGVKRVSEIYAADVAIHVAT